MLENWSSMYDWFGWTLLASKDVGLDNDKIRTLVEQEDTAHARNLTKWYANSHALSC